MSHRRPALFVLLVVTALLAATGGGAVAARLIGSRDIADNSLQSRDVKNGTLSGRDVRNRSLTASDFSGPPPAGARPNATYTWTATFTETGDLGYPRDPQVTSTETLPAGAHLQGLDMDITGDFSRCEDAYVWVAPLPVGTWRPADNVVWANFSNQEARSSRTLDDLQLRPDGPTRLGAYGQCDEGTQALPSFTVTVKFTVTRLTAPKAVQFDWNSTSSPRPSTRPTTPSVVPGG